jgi:hypothetical protein
MGSTTVRLRGHAAVVIATGRLLIYQKPGFTFVKTFRLRTRAALIEVFWREGRPPPSAYDGELITVYGKLITYELGRRPTICDALTLNCSPSIMKQALTNLFKKLGLPVSEYDAISDQGIPLSGTWPVRDPSEATEVSAGLYYGGVEPQNAPDGGDRPPPDAAKGLPAGHGGLPLRGEQPQDGGTRPVDEAGTDRASEVIGWLDELPEA